MIRTLVEIQGGRVSIRETGAETTVTVTVDGALSDPGSLDAAAGRADRIRDLESELARRTQERDEREAARAKLERETTEAIRVLERKVVDYDRDRTTECNRADQNKAWAERAEARLARDEERHVRKMADLDRHIEKINSQLAKAVTDRDRLAPQIGKVSSAVHRPVIQTALRTGWASWTETEAVALTTAVNEVRRVLGTPEPGTSQA